MTLTAQRRRKARAAAVAEPYRQAAIDAALEEAHRTGAEVFVGVTQTGGSTIGVIDTLGDGYVVVRHGKSWTTNVPRKLINRVERMAKGGQR